LSPEAFPRLSATAALPVLGKIFLGLRRGGDYAARKRLWARPAPCDKISLIKEANMSGKTDFDYIVEGVSDGLDWAFGHKPEAASELISLKELAKRIGERLTSAAETDELLGETMLKTLLAQPDAETCKAQEKCVHFAHLRVRKKELRVAVISLESYRHWVGSGIMPKADVMAFYSSRLVDWIVISGLNALVRFRTTLETKEEVWSWAMEMATSFGVDWFGWLGRDYGSWYLLGWPRRRR